MKNFFVLLLLMSQISIYAQKTSPNLILKDIKGNSTTLNEVTNGDTTIVILWASWCTPCYPMLKSFEGLLEDKSINSIIISVDPPNLMRRVSNILKANDISTEKIYFANMQDLGIHTLPYIFIIKDDSVKWYENFKNKTVNYNKILTVVTNEYHDYDEMYDDK